MRQLIFLGNDGIQRLRRLARRSPHGERLAQAVVGRAEECLGAPPITPIYELGRRVMLATSRDMQDRVFHLGIAWFLTGRHAFRLRLIDELLSACRFESWNRSHFLDTAEMLCAVAIGRDWMLSCMSALEAAEIDGGLRRLGLVPGLESLRSGSAWTKTEDNWNVVCCSSLIVAASTLPPDNTLRAELLERAGDAIRAGLGNYAPDGGWKEGLTYWDLATRYAVFAFAALESKGIDHLHAGEFPGLARTWRFARDLVGPSGLAFNSGDGLTEPPHSPVAGWLARLSGETDAIEWQWNGMRPPHPLDLVWYNPPVAAKTVCEPSAAYERAGFGVLRSGSTYLALRFGRNDTNHAHLDLGSFVLDLGGNRIVHDPGREDYAKPGYLNSPARWSYPRSRTSAHNTISLADTDQSPEDSARLVARENTADGPRMAIAVDDPRTSFRHARAYALTLQGGAIVVDRIEPKERRPLTEKTVWRLHVREPVVEGATAGQVRLPNSDITIDLRLDVSETSPLVIERVPELADETCGPVTRISCTFDIPAEGVTVTAVISRQSPEAGRQHAQSRTLASWLAAVLSQENDPSKEKAE